MKYNKILFLSKGGEGSIYEVEKDGVRYALKDIEKSGDINNLRESNYLQKELDHPNIVKIFETYEDDISIVIIMELCHTSLTQELQKRILTKKEIVVYLKQLISAVQYLQQRNIIHNDIKTDNILLCGKDIKLSDFGSTERVSDGFSSFAYSGYAYNLAPEMCCPSYNYSVNIWQIGMVLYVMSFRSLPFKELQNKDAKYCYEYIKNNKINIPFTDFDTHDLLSKMLEKNPNKRITLDEIFLHPFLK